MVCFQKNIKRIKNLFSKIVPSSMVKCEEGKSLPTMSNFLPQNCAFYRIEIHRTVVKQPIRIEYLIKHKPRGTLTWKMLQSKPQNYTLVTFSFSVLYATHWVYFTVSLPHRSSKKLFSIKIWWWDLTLIKITRKMSPTTILIHVNTRK